VLVGGAGQGGFVGSRGAALLTVWCGAGRMCMACCPETLARYLVDLTLEVSIHV
jgi:hypothetical protein